MKSRISITFLSSIHVGETHYNMYKIITADDEGGVALFAWTYAGYNEYQMDSDWNSETDLAKYLVEYHYRQLRSAKS